MTAPAAPRVPSAPGGQNKARTLCPRYLGARVARLTRLDACGRPVEGDESVVTSEGIVNITFEPEVSEGESLDTRNIAGNLCASASTPDVLSGINVSLEFCAWDPAALQMMNPTWKLVRNAEGAITGFRIGESFSDQYGFALEIWPKAVGGTTDACGDDEEEEDPNDPLSLSGYFLLPWVNGRAPESIEMTGDELATFTVNGRTRGGSPWGVGPYLVTRDESGAPSPLLMPIEDGTGSSGYTHPITGRPVTDPDHFHDEIVTVLPPAPGCGAHPLRRPKVDLSCTENGVELTVTNLDQISDPDDVDQMGRRPSVWVTWGDGSGRVDIANPKPENGRPGEPGTASHTYAVPTEHRVIVEAPNGAYRAILVDPNATLAITPEDATAVEVGQWLQLQAMQTPGSGGDPVNVTRQAEWTSSDPTIAAVNNKAGTTRGRVRGLKPGTVTITAKQGCHEATHQITVTGPVQNLVVEGPSEVAIGETISLTATATRQGGDTEDITGQVDWTTSNPAVATVNNGNSPGLVTGVKAGQATIRALLQSPSGQVAGEHVVTVAAEDSTQSVAISGPGEVATGETVALTASATLADGTSKPVTDVATWSSADTAVATVEKGTVTGVAEGTTTITASYKGTDSPAHEITVTTGSDGGGGDGGNGGGNGPTVESIALTPPEPAITVGTTSQLTATATLADGSTQDVTSDVTWSSGTPAVATVDQAGLVTAVKAGQATITAKWQNTTAKTTVTVTPADGGNGDGGGETPTVESIALTPSEPSVAVGQTVQLTATATMSDQSTQDVTVTAQWKSGTPAVVTVNTTGARGLVTGVKPGKATITATYEGVSAKTPVTVTDEGGDGGDGDAPTISSIAVTPANPEIPVDGTEQLVATATMSDQSTQDVTATAEWTSANPASVTVNNAGQKGLVTGVSVGESVVTATVEGQSGETTVTVTAPEGGNGGGNGDSGDGGGTPGAVESLAVTPADPSLTVGDTTQLTATATFADGSTQDFTSAVSWSSADPAVATVNNAGSAGTVTAVAAGTAEILAEYGGMSASSTVTVTAAAAPQRQRGAR